MKSIYIHIPFCENICSYCDFCKIYYNKEIVKKYLKTLETEIKEKYKGEKIETLYIGGGTPSSLDIEELKTLLEIISTVDVSDNLEFTFECNIENIDRNKAILLYKNKVNRISLGVQTFNNKFLKLLNRNHNNEEVKQKIKMLKEIGFKNINIDLMYAFPKQTEEDLIKDLEEYIKLDIPHISTYSLIIEPHTKLYIEKTKNIDEELDSKMYEIICKTLKKHGYNHYEISNFAKENYESKHNLTYWNNEHYYGFGCGASGYIDNIRYTNTKNINKYIKREYIQEQETLDKNITIENEFILGLRKINGINIDEFNKKYDNIFKYKVVNKLLEEKKLIKENNNIFTNPKYIYISNTILVEFIGEKYE